MFYIITKNRVNGFHRWEGAPDEFSYLRNRHRHEFVITCKIPVSHADRDREIIDTQRQIDEYLHQYYGVDSGYHIDIGGMSCEMLAEELAEQFGAAEVAVQEDGEGGALYVRE